MAHYNDSWGMPPLVDSTYMYGGKTVPTEHELRGVVEAYVEGHPEDREVVLKFARAMGWTDDGLA